ncbi:MAG: NAD(P)H-dependent oxidoreductase [Paracoccaceae bacterium]
MLRVLAISGSARAASRSTALLRALASAADEQAVVQVMADLAALPGFSPDSEGPPAPSAVEALLAAIAAADAVVVACPEYVHSFTGILKNAIDWCVSRPEIIHKPIVLAHASHRGDEMLGQLRRVLETVSSRFGSGIFLRVPIASLAEAEVTVVLEAAETRAAMIVFLDELAGWVRNDQISDASVSKTGNSRAFG